MKKTMLDKQNQSDNEDEFDVDEPSEEEPEELQNDASDDDWTPLNEPVGGRRTSGRTRAPKRTLDAEEESSEEISDIDEEDDEDYKGKKKNNKPPAKGRGAKGKAGGGRAPAKKPRSAKKGKKDENDEEDDDENEEDGEESSSEESDSEDVPEGYRSGAFVVMKSDFKNGGAHPIWKIDGKSLLQKFVNMTDEDGDNCYKSTTIYAGWSKTSTSNYHPINVTTKRHQGKDHLVTFDRSQIKSDE